VSGAASRWLMDGRAFIVPTAIYVSDEIARAYGRRPPRYPAIVETLGVALALLVNRNTEPGRALWLVHDDVSGVLCEAAEAFAQTAVDRPWSPTGWRGGALSGLRTLAADTLHEETQEWPHGSTLEHPPLVQRIWLHAPGRELPVWLWSPMVRWGLAAPGRLPDAYDALCDVLGRYAGRLAAWSNLYERPADTAAYRRQIAAVRDPASVPEVLDVEHQPGV